MFLSWKEGGGREGERERGKFFKKKIELTSSSFLALDPPPPLYAHSLLASPPASFKKTTKHQGVSPASRFSKALIKNRVATEWGGFTLASATRALLRAALLDPNNQRFALLSESCLPLYSPAIVYSQLVYSEKSRINACADGEEFFSPGVPSREGREVEVEICKKKKLLLSKKQKPPKYKTPKTGVKADWPLDGYRYSWRMKDATGGKLTGEREEWTDKFSPLFF